MHVLIVSCVYPPEPVVSAQTSAQVAGELVGRGHKVTVVTTFPNRPGGKVYQGYKRRLTPTTEVLDGVDVKRCFSILSPQSGLLSRLLENISFGLTSGWQVLTSTRPDVIYANTWPIFATGIIALIARMRKIPLVLSVQDVYPESLIAQGRIKTDGLLARTLRWIDRWIVHGSQAVVVISQAFREVYIADRQVREDRVHLVPNWIDSESIDPAVPQRVFRQQIGIPQDAVVVAYGGNIGVAAGVENAIEAFLQVQNEDDLVLLIAGEGSRLDTCRGMVDDAKSKRIRFHTPWPQAETSLVLRAADILLLPTRGEQSLASVPSKVMAYMLSARPILATALPRSDLALTIQTAGCGWVVEPDRPDLLAEEVKEIIRLDPAEWQRRGENGRAYALQHFGKDVCLPKVISIITKACQR